MALCGGVEEDTIDGWVGFQSASDPSVRNSSCVFRRRFYLLTKSGISDIQAISKAIADAFSLPCSATNASSRSCLRPTTVTFTPSATKRFAMARPIPLVAPIMRTCLYWKVMLKCVQ